MPDEAGLERLLRELIHRERIANTVSAETARQLDDLFADFAEIIRRYDPTSVQARYRAARVQRILQEIQGRMRVFAPELEKALKDQLAIIGRNQAVLARDALVATLGTTEAAGAIQVGITQTRLRAIMNTDPFQGRLLKEHTQRLSANVVDRVRTAIRTGMTREESIDDIVRRVRGRQAGFIRQDTSGRFVARGTRAATVRPRFVGGVLSTTTRDAEALVRTAVNHISNVGMMSTFEANADVVEGLEVVAVLDAATTEICLSLDGTVYALDDPNLRLPPYHWRCRTITVARIAWDRLGLEPPPEPDRSVRDLSGLGPDELSPARGRAGDVVRIPFGQKAADWLRQQPVAAQNRLLGKTKAAAFRSGKITLKDLVRDDYSIVPLSELNLN